MTLWLVLALMTAATVFAVLWPLSLRVAPAGRTAEIPVYRDQLDEIAHNRSAGLIGAAEVEAARVEVPRRLLAAAAEAAAIWRDMLAQVPPDWPWARNLRQALAGPGAPQASALRPHKVGIASAAPMREQDRGAAISGRGARPAARLKQNGNDANGWQQALRGDMVRGERDKALEAAADAREALAGAPGRLYRVETVMRNPGLEG